jgi:hypothetical protein
MSRSRGPWFALFVAMSMVVACGSSGGGKDGGAGSAGSGGAQAGAGGGGAGGDTGGGGGAGGATGGASGGGGNGLGACTQGAPCSVGIDCTQLCFANGTSGTQGCRCSQTTATYDCSGPCLPN